MKRLLDLFCCAGGAAKGYADWFEVVGVDIDPQPNYPYEFHQADALTFPLDGFDAIHASPPCQDHSPLHHSAGSHGTGWMLTATLERLRASGRPWIVENVSGSGLAFQSDLFGEHGVLLCGATFGLGVDGWDLSRHRLFQSNVPLTAPACSHQQQRTIGVYGHGMNRSERDRYGGELSTANRKLAMGIDWMTRDELSQAIPPAYTRFLGEQLLTAIQQAV